MICLMSLQGHLHAIAACACLHMHFWLQQGQRLKLILLRPVLLRTILLKPNLHLELIVHTFRCPHSSCTWQWPSNVMTVTASIGGQEFAWCSIETLGENRTALNKFMSATAAKYQCNTAITGHNRSCDMEWNEFNSTSRAGHPPGSTAACAAAVPSAGSRCQI